MMITMVLINDDDALMKLQHHAVTTSGQKNNKLVTMSVKVLFF